MFYRFLLAKRRLIRAMIHSCSFTGALFVFQACYGPPPGVDDTVYIKGKVKSSETSQPIQGIRVSLNNDQQSDITKSDGFFSFQADSDRNYSIKFKDIDSTLNGSYKDKEISLKNIDKDTTFEVLLDENK